MLAGLLEFTQARAPGRKHDPAALGGGRCCPHSPLCDSLALCHCHTPPPPHNTHTHTHTRLRLTFVRLLLFSERPKNKARPFISLFPAYDVWKLQQPICSLSLSLSPCVCLFSISHAFQPKYFQSVWHFFPFFAALSLKVLEQPRLGLPNEAKLQKLQMLIEHY